MQNVESIDKRRAAADETLHVTLDPQPAPQAPGTIVDPHGDPFPRRMGMMSKLDDRAKEPVTLSKWAMWFVGTAVASVSVIITVVICIVTVAIAYQATASQVTNIDKRVDNLEKAMLEFQTMKLSVNDIKNDVSTIKKVQDNSEQDRKEVMKNISDIRILLGQKKLQEGQ